MLLKPGHTAESFNTQPPEGGWVHSRFISGFMFCFNTQPPEGGWTLARRLKSTDIDVSTHSRLKAAGACLDWLAYPKPCFNTQPPEGGWKSSKSDVRRLRSFNTQPPEGGWNFGGASVGSLGGFNTQPPEGGWVFCMVRHT